MTNVFSVSTISCKTRCRLERDLGEVEVGGSLMGALVGVASLGVDSLSFSSFSGIFSSSSLSSTLRPALKAAVASIFKRILRSALIRCALDLDFNSPLPILWIVSVLLQVVSFCCFSFF